MKKSSVDNYKHITLFISQLVLQRDLASQLRKVKLLELFEREAGREKKNVFEATVTEVRAHGLMVELTASNAYGLVHISTMTDDYYRLNDRGDMLMGGRTGRRFSPGSQVRVTVDRVDRFKRQVDFRLAEEPEAQKQRGDERRRGRGGNYGGRS